MPDTHARTGELTFERLPPLTAPPPLTSSEISLAAAACANCGTVLTGPYCARCGQHVADFHRSVWRFVAEFFDNTICWDNKLLRTLEPLFKQPGFLTSEFMAGRRVRYVHPLRLFLFTSAVCLTLMQYNWSRNFDTEVTTDKHGRVHTTVGIHDRSSTPVVSPTLTATPEPTFARAESPTPSATPAPSSGEDRDDDNDPGARAIKKALGDKFGKIPTDGNFLPKNFGDRIAKSAEKAASATDKAAEEGTAVRLRRAIEGIQQRLSWVALALLPVFALFLRSMYWREDSFYFAHLIFSLHYHTFLLLFWTAYTGLGLVASHLPISGLWHTLLSCCLLLPPCYLFLALRQNYQESKRRTWTKVFLLGGLHLIAIVIGVSAIGAMGFITASK